MPDQDIIELCWQRDEMALSLTRQRYGNYALAIASRILIDAEDVQECLNDSWLRIWQAIPPARPQNFKAWLARIIRNEALRRLEKNQAQKRGGGQLEICLDELAHLLPSQIDQPDDLLLAQELGQEINRFLAAEPAQIRSIFVGRYFYFASLTDLAAQTGLKKSQLSVQLYRTRQKLKKHLAEKGFP